MSRVLEEQPLGKFTYEDYVGLPDDGRRYEIVDGGLEVSPAPTPRHQAVSGNLLVILHGHVRERGLGWVYHAPIDVILAPDSVVQPDLVFVAADHDAIITERAIEGTPDLVVEILSPGSEHRDHGARAALYARHGVPHYWIADPVARTLHVYELDGGAYRPVAIHAGTGAVARSTLFPDLGIELDRIWV